MKYSYLAESLKSLLEKPINEAVNRNPDARVRRVLIGPPPEALEALYNLLTSNGTSDWHINGMKQDIVVLYIQRTFAVNSPSVPAVPSQIFSKKCNWNYAVTARNNFDIIIMLVDPQEWDSRHESLANTTETLGGLSTEPTAWKLTGSIWTHIINQVVGTTGLRLTEVRYALREIAKQSRSLEPSIRNRMTWEIADELLAPAPTSIDSFALIMGLPPLENTGISIQEAFPLMHSLGSFLSRGKLKDSIQKLKETQVAISNSLQPHLDALSSHIRQKSLTGAYFAQAPSWFYRPSRLAPQWWLSLNASLLSQMLNERDDRHPNKLDLRCINALNQDMLKGEPFIVINEVRLHAQAPENRPLSTLTFSGKADRNNFQLNTPGLNNNGECVNANPPSHEKPIRYTVSSPGFSPGNTEVLVLNQFACKGIARARDAERQNFPTKDRNSGAWTQEITLPRGGPIDLKIYHASEVTKIKVQVIPFVESNSSLVTPLDQEYLSTIPGQSFVHYGPEIENKDNIEVTLIESIGNIDKEVATWAIQFKVEEVTDTSLSYFESLVSAHQDANRGRVPPPQPSDSHLRQLEREYLLSPNSWKPILACWSKEVKSLQKIDWSDPHLGDRNLSVDPRPVATPPQSLLNAREDVRLYLHLLAGQKLFGQIYLGEDVLVQKVELYLQQYLDWLKSEPKQATWFDCISIHHAPWNPEANDNTAKTEPTAMLLSPLHPLRLAWHCLAQQQLYTSLNHRCPAAGLLDPHSCPDIGTWHIPEGSESFVPKIFFTVAGEDPHWMALLNKDILEPNSDERKDVLKRLSELGLRVKGVVGGFSISQTQNSIDEVTRLLSARAILRLGLVSRGETSAECAKGIIDWCQFRFDRGEDESYPRYSMPMAAEIYDLRADIPSYPSQEQLATLSENTQEKVRWFKPNNMLPNHQLDLVILDQLGAVSLKGWDNSTRSPMGYGALHRLRIREDFQDAVWLDESRIGTHGTISTGIAGLLEESSRTYEELAAQLGQISQLRFQPNRQAIERRLKGSTFLAVTSAQIDPAGIIRGARGERGYLWDYLLPDALGGGENSAGYYLIAKPLPAMENAIKKAVRMVTSTLPSDLQVKDFLNEISRRGLPILKRLAAGGSQSRGELGMLLAVRLLQDAFRDGAQNIRLPVWAGDCIHLILPVDPYQNPFDRLRRSLGLDSDQKPDLLVIAIQAPSTSVDSHVKLKITPVEVKFRSGRMSEMEDELQEALGQAANLGKLLSKTWTDPLSTSLWDTCTAGLLAQCLNLAFRIYADEDVHKVPAGEWTKLQERVLRDVLSKQAIIEVDKAGRLLVFDASGSSFIRDLDADGQFDTLILNRDDAKVLLTGTGILSPDADMAAKILKFSFPNCDEQKQPSLGININSDASTSSKTSNPNNLEQNNIVTSIDEEEADNNPESNLLTDEEFDGISISHKEDISNEESSEPNNIATSPIPTPRAFIGWTEPTSRWTLIGKLDTTGEPVALDFDNPKTIGIFGYMGSGKSYLVGTLIESALMPILGINKLPVPLSVVIFNYRRNSTDRFEMSSLAFPNSNQIDLGKLKSEYSATPRAIQDIHILCLPGELDEVRRQEYGKIPASELFFDPSSLSIEDWELLMGEPESQALFARMIRHILGELNQTGNITLERLEQQALSQLSGVSRKAAEDRFRMVRKYISPSRGTNFEDLVRPGRAVIVDLRNRVLFSKEDALRFFLVCANRISQIQKHFNKIIIFDEAHEYLSNEFGEKIQSRIRLMRHDGTSYVFATQDVESIPLDIRRFINNKFVFSLGSRQNAEDLLRFAPEFKNQQIMRIPAGYCMIQTDQSVGDMFEYPRLVHIRPRMTQHGGVSQIFSTNPLV